MKIESLIKRKNGSKVDMEAPKRQYHFKPTEDDERHIADVDVEHHAKSLLRITEGYRAVDAADFQDSEDEDDLPGRHLNGSTVHSASYVIKGGDSIDLQDLVNMAFDDSGLTEDEWNALDDADRYVYIDTTLNELQDGEHGDDQEDQVQTQQPANTASDTADNKPADDAAAGTDGSDNTPAASESGNDQVSPSNDANGNGVDDNLEGLTRKQLEPLYKDRFGRLPSSQMTVPQIRAALSEDDD